MYKQLVFILLVVSIVSACASRPVPQTANEYRMAVKEGPGGTKLDSYIVKRSYSRTVKLLKEKARQCLKKTVVVRTCGGYGGCNDVDYIYTPKVLTKPKSAELHVQWRMSPEYGANVGGKPPADGMYVVVIDVEPAGKRKTRITAYYTTYSFHVIPDAIKHWLKGTSKGCPDLSKSIY